MSSLALIISFVDLDEDYSEADFNKYEKEHETSKRQGEPVESHSDKQIRTAPSTVDIVPANPHSSTEKEDDVEDRNRKGKAVADTPDSPL